MKITSFKVRFDNKKPVLNFDITFDTLIPSQTRTEIKYKVRKAIEKVISPNEFLQNHKHSKKEEFITIREASALLKVPHNILKKWRKDPLLIFPAHEEYGKIVYYKSELEKFRRDNPGLFGKEKLITINEVKDILIAPRNLIFKWRNDPKTNFPFYQKTKTSRILYYESEIRDFMEKNPHLNFTAHKELGTTVYYNSELEKFRSDNPGFLGIEKLLTIKEVANILIIDRKLINQLRNDPKNNFPFYQKSKTSRIFYYESKIRDFMEKNPELFK